MLRSEGDDRRLVKDVRQILVVPRRKSVMLALLNMIQFVERIAVRQPGRPFLVGREQVAGAVEVQTVTEADPGRENLPFLAICGQFQDCAAFRRDVIMRCSVLDEICVGVIRGAEAEVEVAVAIGGAGRGR